MIDSADAKWSELNIRGQWTPAEKRAISSLIDGLDDALVGLEAGLSWWPSTFYSCSFAGECLRGFIEASVWAGSLNASKLFHRVLGHLPIGWTLTDYLFLIQSTNEDDVARYANHIGAMVAEGDLGFDGLCLGEDYGLYGAIISDDRTVVSIDEGSVRLSMHCEFRHPVLMIADTSGAYSASRTRRSMMR